MSKYYLYVDIHIAPINTLEISTFSKFKDTA